MLTRVFFYVVLIPISLLPFPILYFISDGLYFIIYKVLGYRKKVVFQNVANSFPQKSREEQLRIVSDFYRHLCDLVVESVKIFTISEAEVKQRFGFVNPEFINRFCDQGKSVIIAGGHINNWELLAVAIDAQIKHNTVALYKRLANPFFDEKMRATRGKYGLKMVATKDTKAEFEKREPLCAYIFGFDQSPRNEYTSYWATFLNQDTAMNFGVEKYSKEYDLPVLYGRINKVKRGHYTFEFTEAIENPQQTSRGFITTRINHLLEQDIIATPEYWLWSHKRWKMKRPADLVQE
jgi:Kdo2-lipid IVA lauroyltransferase/acyltransferase